MVALLGFLDELDVLLELLVGRERHAVDPLEHLGLLVAAPVGPGDRDELERPDVRCPSQVRTAAQVIELPLVIQGNGVRIHFLEHFYFIYLAFILESLDRIGFRYLFAGDLEVLPGDLSHLGLYLFEVFGNQVF